MTEHSFVEYCLDFYGQGGIYDIGATASDIRSAVRRLNLSHFDSFDRELVRERIEDNQRKDAAQFRALKDFEAEDDGYCY